LVCLVAAAYGQTLAFDLVWDDPVLFVDHPTVRGHVRWWEFFTSPTSIFLGDMPGAHRMYRPFLGISGAADRGLWGERAGLYHLSSVLAHLAVVLLLRRIARGFTGSLGAAFVAAALLAVHPAAVEAVAFISARMDLFAALGMAGVVLLLGNCLGPGGALRVVGALLSFTFALLSKETAIVIPAVVTWAAYAYPAWFAGPNTSPRAAALVARLAPFWGLLALYAAVRSRIVGGLAPVPLAWSDLPAQVPRALAVIATYGQMILLPSPATGVIEVPLATGFWDARLLLGLAALALLPLALLWLRRRLPPAACALGWCVAALVPASNLVPIYSKGGVQVAERTLYPALVGWCLFLAVVAHAVSFAARSRWRLSPVVAKTLGGTVVALFVLVSTLKVGAWRDNVTLWTSAVEWSPGSVEARTKLASALARSGDGEGARAVLSEAAARFPADPRVAYMAGLTAELRGEDAEALRQYERAITLGAGVRPAYQQAAFLAARLQEWERAGHWFAAAASHFPQAAWPHVGLGWYWQRQGRADAARQSFARAERLEPRSAERSWLLAILLSAEGRSWEARQAAEAALALDPSFVPARRALALTAEQAGRTEEAIRHWQQIAALLPVGHRAEAEEHLRRLEKDRPPEAAGAGPARPR
jgi:cytochrome c-type biogenesis protein CcmH/NrfG